MSTEKTAMSTEKTAMTTRRPYCPACQRPQATCLCELALPVSSPWPLVILQDPAEAQQAKGTVALLKACMPELTIWQGLDLAGHSGLDALLQDPRLFALLVYPGEQAKPASAWRPVVAQSGKTPCFILIDGTWRKSLRLLHSHPALLNLPRITLERLPASGYHIRKSNREGGLSTLEAAAALLGEWSEEPARFAPLLASFDRWISRELARLPAAQLPK